MNDIAQKTRLPAYPHEGCREGEHVQSQQHHDQSQNDVAEHQSAGPLNGMLSVPCAEARPCGGDARDEV